MSSFFEDSSVEDVAESHAAEMRSLEAGEVDRILGLYKGVRNKLRDRLDSMPEGTFTTQRTQGALLQVEAAIQEMNRILKSEMGDSAASAAELGVGHLIKELNKWDKTFTGAVIPINLNVVKVASETSNFLFNKYEVSISAYSEQLRSVFAQGITNAAIEEVGMSEVVSRISKTFMGEEWKLNRLVRTEMQGIYSLGKLNGMRDLADSDVPDLKKTLWHPMDSRTGKDSKRLANDNPIIPVDEPFVEYSTGKRLTYMAPPNRPNDRAILIPYRDGWAK